MGMTAFEVPTAEAHDAAAPQGTMIRRWLFPVLLIAALWYLVGHRTELGELGRTLALGRWQWVVLAGALQVVYYLAYAWLYCVAFEVVGVKSRLRDAFVLLIGSLFVNVVVPSAGAAGAALFVDDAARRGQSPTRAAAGIVLQMVGDFSALAIILAGSLVYLAGRHDLRSFEVWGTTALVLLTAGLALLLLFGLWRPRWLHRLLGGIETGVGRLAARTRRGSPLGEGWAARTAEEFIAVGAGLRARPQRLAGLLGVAVAMHALDLASLAVLFPAFHQDLRPGALVAGYALGIMAWILSPVAQGIGVVEGVMALVIGSLGVSAEPATLIALTFRGLTFWLPMLVGFALLRWLPLLGKKA